MDHDLERPRIKRQNKHKLRSLLSIHNIDAETFLNPSHQYTIPNYNTYRTDRLTNKGGGAAIPTKNNKTQSTRHSHQKYGNHSCTTLHLERTHQPARSVQSPQDAVFQTRQATIPYKNLTSTYRLETINDLSSDHLPVVLALHLDGFNTWAPTAPPTGSNSNKTYTYAKRTYTHLKTSTPRSPTSKNMLPTRSRRQQPQDSTQLRKTSTRQNPSKETYLQRIQILCYTSKFNGWISGHGDISL